MFLPLREIPNKEVFLIASKPTLIADLPTIIASTGTTTSTKDCRPTSFSRSPAAEYCVLVLTMN